MCGHGHHQKDALLQWCVYQEVKVRFVNEMLLPFSWSCLTKSFGLTVIGLWPEESTAHIDGRRTKKETIGGHSQLGTNSNSLPKKKCILNRLDIATDMASYVDASTSYTHVTSKIKDIIAQKTTSASIRFHISRKYDPGWAITPRSMTYNRQGSNFFERKRKKRGEIKVLI